MELDTGTFTLSSSGTTKVTVGFKPDYLIVYLDGRTKANSTTSAMNVYDSSISTSSGLAFTTSGASEYTIGTGSLTNRIWAIDNDGFTMTKAYSSSWLSGWRYIAIKN